MLEALAVKGHVFPPLKKKNEIQQIPVSKTSDGMIPPVAQYWNPPPAGTMPPLWLHANGPSVENHDRQLKKFDPQTVMVSRMSMMI